MRNFWRYLQDTGVTDADPLRRISAPKQPRRLPTYLQPDELTALLDASQRQRTAYGAFRDYAIMATFVFTGVRRGELLDLRVHDVDLGGMVLRVRKGKGAKERELPMVEDVGAALRDWLEFRRARAHDYLFTTVRGNRIHISRLQIIGQPTMQASGITRPDVSMHTLRHSMATLLLQNGSDLVSIQQLLGHTRLDTTAIYLHLGSQELEAAVGKHPLARGGGNCE